MLLPRKTAFLSRGARTLVWPPPGNAENKMGKVWMPGITPTLACASGRIWKTERCRWSHGLKITPQTPPVGKVISKVSAGAAPAAAHHEENYQPVFVGPVQARLEALYPHHPTRQACLLPALWIGLSAASGAAETNSIGANATNGSRL